MASEGMESEVDDMSSLGASSHTFSASSRPRPRYPGNAPAEPGSSSSTSHHHDIPPYEEVPASFIPADWPEGPRELDPGHFICPFKGCRRATGRRSSGRGYTEDTLPDHLLIAHGGPDGFQSMARELRLRVRFLRRNDGNQDDENAEHQSRRGLDRGDPDGDLQQQARAVIAYLEELAAWERSWRHLRPSGPAAAAAEEPPRRARLSARSRSMSPRAVPAAAAERAPQRTRDPVRSPSISTRRAPRESLEIPAAARSRTRTRHGTHPRGDVRAARETTRNNVARWRVTLYGADGPVVISMDFSGPPTGVVVPHESEYPHTGDAAAGGYHFA